MEALLEVKGLTKAYPGFTLDHVSFTVPKGAIVGLVGANGAGKSTTIKAMLGLVTPDEGSASFWGQSLAQAPACKEEIGVVFDGLNFYQTLTPAKVGRILRAAYRRWDDALYKEYIQRFALPLDKEIRQLSKGMKAKLGIAAALAHRPRLLILDEATSGLDPVVRDSVTDLLLDFTRDAGHSVLISSHIVSDLEKVCDYIAFLHKGRLMLLEEKDTLLEEYGLLQCSAEEAGAIDPSAVIGRRDNPYGCRLIVRKDALPRGSVTEAVSIEELFIFMVKEDKK